MELQYEVVALLVAERGLGAMTLDAVAEQAACSLPSLHTVFKGRDSLLGAVYELYGPLPDLEALAADPPERLKDTVQRVYRAVSAPKRSRGSPITAGASWPSPK
ncbi:hypothetical protein ACIQ9Q_41870 [Streptomyces sp. NPDC094438]|uniref:hypothetical protein n=1 Tax=Streptomyces sp. NPDC094438 TaxID=3366061 RepID=UPI00382B13C4